MASLIFLAALALAFMASVSTELRSSKAYSAGVNSKLLGQTAVNLAMAQISAATKGVDAGGGTLAWASQPGMIRTYDTTGNPVGYYRLYSWTDMTGSGVFKAGLATNTVPSDWSSSKAIFTDLNQPIRIPSGSTNKLVYPIVDGNGLSTMALANVGSVKSYGTNTPDVDGFYVANAPVGSGGNANPIPMPVKWLYVLENGSVVAPSAGSDGGKASIAGASSTNQIVGRFAFWADDETCKININTAAEGTYWDTPKVSSAQDLGYATNQPAQHEYQRYSGHPATVSLSTVFKSLTPEQIYDIAPRVVGGSGSSMEGTKSGSAVLNPDADRLYATTDEFVFSASMASSTRTDNNAAAINADSLGKFKFFLTSASRAPDLNLFNTPRVSIWPINATNDDAHRTAFDKLIAFCSSLRTDLSVPYAYYFQRSDPNSQTIDLPSGAADSGLGRNRRLLEYLQRLTSQNVPGFGGNFVTKYNSSNGLGGTDRDQILTEIFDYIRSQNVADVTVSVPYQKTVGTDSPASGSGQVVPIQDATNGTRGFGRFPTIQGGALLFAGVATGTGTAASQTKVEAAFFVNLFCPTPGYPAYNPNLKLRVSGLDGFTWQSWDTNNQASTVNMKFPSGGLVYPTTWKVANEEFVGGSLDIQKFFANQIWSSPPAYSLLVRGSNGVYMPSQASASPPTSFFEFGGGTVRVEVLAPDYSTVVQTVELSFPSQRFPVPMLAPSAFGAYNFRVWVGNTSSRFVGNYNVSVFTPNDVVRSVVPAEGDLRLAMPRSSITVLNPIYSALYAPHKYYNDPTKMLAHNLRDGANQPYYGATAGHFLANRDYSYSARDTDQYLTSNPYVASSHPRDSSVVPNTNSDILGDWDNGQGHMIDGPYINKADEGTYNSSAGNMSYYGNWPRFSASIFSPNRMMPSAGVFGSLPSEVWAGKPWQTLLFCPNPLAGSAHRGFGVPSSGPPYTTPPDHLILDLFNMPVVEPYAISEPLSTAGRINMNYQMVPFSYIHRDTGLRAVLKAEQVISIPDQYTTTYKTYASGVGGAVSSFKFRLPIDSDQTLKGFQKRFDSDDIFRSPSEVCSLYLVPQGESFDNMASYWSDKRLTGDNSRERPYTTIYPKLTTKSNTFTIYYRAESLQKVDRNNPASWDESKDKVVGEYRGSQLIERYVDPNDQGLPDYANAGTTTPISDFYKFRVIQAKQFAP